MSQLISQNFGILLPRALLTRSATRGSGQIHIRTGIWLASSNTGYCFLTMFLWYPVMDLARAPRRAPLTAHKKGSGYENGNFGRSNCEVGWEFGNYKHEVIKLIGNRPIKFGSFASNYRNLWWNSEPRSQIANDFGDKFQKLNLLY
jgi:hypothetical protein